MTQSRRLGRATVVVAVALMLGGCTAGQPASGPASANPSPRTSPPASASASAPAAAAPTDLPTDAAATPEPAPAAPIDGAAPLPGLPAGPTTLEQPVPKVERGPEPSEVQVTAPPSDTREKVSYADGLQLDITDVAFVEETGEGPGRFTGRQLAILSLQMANGTDSPMTLDTVVVTVLDEAGAPVPPVYVDGQDVRDFSGVVAPGDTASARYAFAVPAESRSQVTVVVDFDGRHTSAVFRGSLE